MSPHRSSTFPITRRAALAAGALALRLPTRALAQSSPKTLRVGCVGLQPRSSTIYTAFLRGMSGLGYEDGKNFTFDYVQTPSIQEFPDAYAKVVSRGTDVLIAAGSEPALRAARAAAGHIPIIFFALDFDPIEKGYVASLARPGGDITGVFVRQIELTEKRVELAREALPEARILTVLWDAASHDQAVTASAAASFFGFEPHLVEAAGQPSDYGAALALTVDRPSALMLIPASPQFYRDRAALFGLLLERRNPSIGAFPEYAEAGALLSYGVNVSGVLQDGARYVDRIARGAKPADLPVEQPTHFSLTVNLKTARLLGLTIPPSLLARADEVIE